MKIHLFIWIVIFGGQLSAQTIEDLLYKVESQTGKAKIETLFEVGQIYLKTAPPKAIFYLEKALSEAKNLNDTQLLIRTYLNLTEAIQEQYNYAIQYEAKEGELISNICKRFGITREELTKNNYLPEDKEVIGSYRNTFEISSSLYFIQPLAFKQVAEYYEEALKLRRTQNNNNYLIFTLKKAGDFYVQEQQFDKAEKHYLEWLEIRRTQKDTTKLVWVLRHLADFYRESEQNIQAKKFYDEIIAIDKIRKNKNDFANTLAEISLIYPEPLTAEKYFHQALKFWIAEKNQTKIEEMRMKYILNFRKYRTYEAKNNEAYFLQLLDLSKISMDTFLLKENYQDLLYFYYSKKKYIDKTKGYIDSLWNFLEERQLLGEPKYTYGLAYIFTNLTKAQAKQNKGLVEYLYRFDKYYTDSTSNESDLRILLSLYNGFDAYYRKVEKYDSAAYFFKKRLPLIEKLPRNLNRDFSYEKTGNLNNLAFLYQKAGNYKEALVYFKKAMKLQKARQNPVLVSLQLNKIGYLYEEQLEAKKMHLYYKKALKNLKKITKEDCEAETTRTVNVILQLWRITELYEKQAKYKVAIQFLEKSFEMAMFLDKLKYTSYDYNYPFLEDFEKYLEKLKNKK